MLPVELDEESGDEFPKLFASRRVPVDFLNLVPIGENESVALARNDRPDAVERVSVRYLALGPYLIVTQVRADMVKHKAAGPFTYTYVERNIAIEVDDFKVFGIREVETWKNPTPDINLHSADVFG